MNPVVIYLTNVWFIRVRWCFATLFNYFVVFNICSSSTFIFDKSTYSLSSMVKNLEFWSSHRVKWRLCCTRWYSCSTTSQNLITWKSHYAMVAKNPSSYICSIDNKHELKATTSLSFTFKVASLHLKSFVSFSKMMLTSCNICVHLDTLEDCDSMLNSKPTLCSFSCPNFVWSFTTTWWVGSNTQSTNLSPPPSFKSSSTIFPINKKNK